MSLSATEVENAKPGEKTRRLYDALGLYLEIPPTGNKRWRLKYRYWGKENRLSLGLYPDVSLEDARAERDRLRALSRRGINPSEERRGTRADEQREAERKEAVRFSLDSDGALSVRLYRRSFDLNPGETADLRAFLEATKAVSCKEH